MNKYLSSTIDFGALLGSWAFVLVLGGSVAEAVLASAGVMAYGLICFADGMARACKIAVVN